MASPPAQSNADLSAELRRLFGFEKFRPSQEEVCGTLAGGEDVLLVMPTGAGKSLCYQLPGMILRSRSSGSTLVVSPLLALIDDQTAKLRSFGFRAEAIHSGISRERSRAVCRDYLQGDLDFLFIAPERLAVPGFPEMLARRRPALIAIDEAHCISQWGHDFRPEYRRLGERVASLRPAPIIALTATATPVVQDDILGQLEIPLARRFIQGFRRDNLSIEAHEVPQGARARAAIEILSEPGRLPAIIYAPTRKLAEEIAGELRPKFRADSYHAGMPAESREAVQSRFLGTECDVIVATIAFGMGIDKPDVRTVIHAGLSGSVEGYYQEIGRAGRDGQLSKAILLYAYADLRTHEFFFERDYPEIAELRRIHRALPEAPVPLQWLRAELGRDGGDTDALEKAIEKLWIHGGAAVDPDENIARGPASPDNSWEKPYARQREYKRRMLKQMAGFAESSSCRMAYFIKHFGDRADAAGPCGICDRCRPEATGRRFSSSRVLNASELRQVALIMGAIAGAGTLSAGKLFEEVQASDREIHRSAFEKVLRALTDASWLTISEESFEKGGERIAYRKIRATARGASASHEDLARLEISEAASSPRATRRPGPRAGGKSPAPGEWSPECERIFEGLRSWRTREARSQGVPAFRVLSDRVLKAMALARPGSRDDLLRVNGIGPRLCEKYGRELLSYFRNASPSGHESERPEPGTDASGRLRTD